MGDCSCFDDNGVYCANCLAHKYAQEMIDNLRANVAEDKKRREEQLKNLAGMKDEDINLSDIPALTDEQLETAIRGRMRRAYNATPEQLGKAAVEGACREAYAEWNQKTSEEQTEEMSAHHDDDCFAYTEMRDMEKNPYTPDEQRVAEYLYKLTKGLVGGGNDPIGFLIASHAVFCERERKR